MQAAYDDDRPTAVLPGTDNTITGVAVNEWLDDDGNPKFGKDEQTKKDDEQDEQQDADAKKRRRELASALPGSGNSRSPGPPRESRPVRAIRCRDG